MSVISGRITYTGNVAFEEAGDPVWTVDHYGLDSCRWPWQGAEFLEKAFVDGLIRFQNIANHPRVYLMGWGNDQNPIFPTVELTYSGLRNGRLPPAKAVDSKSVQTVQAVITAATGKYSGKQITMELTYRASRTQYNWIEDSLPNKNAPLYGTVRNPVDPLNLSNGAILQRRVTDDKGAVGSLDIGTFTQLMNALLKVTEVSDYTSEEIVPGALWACSSTADYVLKGT